MFPSGISDPQKNSLPVAAVATSGASGNSDGDEASGSSFIGHKVSIKGLDKPLLLQSLYEHANGNGELFASRPKTALALNLLPPMKYQDAQQYVAENPSLNFDYVLCKPIKSNIAGDYMEVSRYDDYNGEGAGKTAVEAAFCVSTLRQSHEKGLARFDQLTERFGIPDHQSPGGYEQLDKMLGYALFGKAPGDNAG
ncbi:hypothetical protein [Endozoicomonas sp. YOMI1]|uniref:hypothetical protein n=1 Tax=Endozoicomonas sp. YOMI1 TaxID=2828739 RepID=UPI0021476266|nr:hypothetical protein [Endozoicomonas sp. YOMI1]